MTAALWIAVGVIVGWNLPQPEWAHTLQEKVVTWVKAQFSSNA